MQELKSKITATKLTPSTRALFDAACDIHASTPSQVLRKFAQEYIDNNLDQIAYNRPDLMENYDV